MVSTPPRTREPRCPHRCRFTSRSDRRPVGAAGTPSSPPATGRGRPRRWPVRGLVDGSVTAFGPVVHGETSPSGTARGSACTPLFACWQLLGVWGRVETALREAADTAGKLSWQVSVGSTTARGHIHAVGARRDSVDRVVGEPDHHAWGRSRGGWGTKTHAAVEPAPRGALIPARRDRTTTWNTLTARSEKSPALRPPPRRLEEVGFHPGRRWIEAWGRLTPTRSNSWRRLVPGDTLSRTVAARGLAGRVADADPTTVKPSTWRPTRRTSGCTSTVARRVASSDPAHRGSPRRLYAALLAGGRVDHAAGSTRRCPPRTVRYIATILGRALKDAKEAAYRAKPADR